MRLFNNNIVPYASTEGDKIYPIVVDIKKGIKSGEAISFVTADNQVGVITVDFMDGNSSYSIEGCMVTSTIRRPDGTVLEIPCDIISQSTIEIPLGINGTYQEGVHTFDLKIVRGNGKVIGVPTMSYSVSGSLSSDGVVEGDDRLPVLTMVLDNAQDKLTRLDRAIAGATNDLEVKEARDGEVTLNARLERDLAKGKIHFVDVEGSSVSTESEEGYFENVEIHGNTWQNAENLSDIRSVGTKVEGQELYEIDIVSCGKNLNNSIIELGGLITSSGLPTNNNVQFRSKDFISVIRNKSVYATINEPNLVISGFYSYDKNKNFISTAIQGAEPPENCKYLKVFGRHKVSGTDISSIISDNIKVQIEYGTQATPYEPYQEDKLTILSPTPLEKVGDVADRIVCKDGVWGVEKNINTKILDKEGFTSVEHTLANGIKTVRYVKRISDAKVSGKIISSKYMYDSFCTRDKSIWIHHLESVLWFVDTDMSNLNDFTILVKYQLAESQFIPLPHSQQVKLRTFANKTNISFLTEIEGTIKAQIPKSLGATVNTHTTQIDNLNKELDRVKKLEESTVSTVTSDKAFTTVSETSNGYFEDVKIEGKTLVNLAGSVNDYFNQFAVVARTCMLLKRNTEYTAVISNKADHLVRIYGNEGSILATPTFDMPAKTTIIKKLHTKDVVDDTGLFKSNSTTGTLFKLDILLLEGDHTDKDISYFEGLKSVGQGSDGIEISSQNKNILPIEELKKYIGNGLVNEDLTFNVTNNNKIIVNGTSNNIWDFRPINSAWTPKFFKYINSLPIGTSIRLSNNLGFNSYWAVTRNGTVNYLGNTITIQQEDSGINGFVRIPQGYSFENNQELQLQIEFGTNATNYVTPKIYKKEILYYNPTTQTWEKPILREWDSVEKHSNGKYYYHKRSGEVILNGSENWQLPVGERWNNKASTCAFMINIKGAKGCSWGEYTPRELSSKFSNYGDTELYNSDIEGFTTDNEQGNRVFRVLKTKLSTQDVAGFKQWLQANPTTVVYELAQEEVYECTNLDLITYSGETNLIVNSGAIQPRITLKVLSNVSNVVKLLQEKVSILENKFIKGLQQVLAGDMMSLAHLLYPEDFEHEIQTLEL